MPTPTTARKYRPGTRIEVRGFDLNNQLRWEAARIGAYRKESEPRPAGYHPVTFAADSARLLVHESGFRVVDNRAQWPVETAAKVCPVFRSLTGAA